jgi:hypothetical protein
MVTPVHAGLFQAIVVVPVFEKHITIVCRSTRGARKWFAISFGTKELSSDKPVDNYVDSPRINHRRFRKQASPAICAIQQENKNYF